MKRRLDSSPARLPAVVPPASPTDDALLAAYKQNWLHIRHVESQRMLSLNAFVAILVAVIYALSRPEGAFFAPYAIAVLIFFSVVNLISAIKIEAVIQDYVARNTLIATALHITNVAGSRVRRGFSGAIRLGWVFPVFYAAITFVLAVYVAAWAIRLLAYMLR